jgi:amino acid transporter
MAMGSFDMLAKILCQKHKGFSADGAICPYTTLSSRTFAEAHGLGKKMRLLPLVGATYFMVAGGPYGLEDIIGKAGYGRALLLLLLIPLVWSLPTSLMVGELAAAIPEEGGFYAWVRRALGGFWGFQEAWLSLAASVFDMALYPVTFVLYLGKIAPAWTDGHGGTLWALAVVIGCALWNLRGAKAVGGGSVWLFTAMLAPFVALVAIGLWRGFAGHAAGGGLHALTGSTATPDMAAAISVCLWNYMGWDNASTIAQEVDRPQRTYPRAMLISAALVAATYILPLAAVAVAGIPAEQFSTGAWADAAKTLGGAGVWGVGLALAVVIGGTISGVGMFNALMMSYTRIPYALALEHLLPKAFARVTKNGVPWLSVLLCAGAWGLAVQMSFERLISIDLVLYGASLVLEFMALVVLRVREPQLTRPFRVPGKLFGAVMVGIGPLLLILFAMWAARTEQVLGMSALLFASLVALGGPLIYGVARFAQVRRARP